MTTPEDWHRRARVATGIDPRKRPPPARAGITQESTMETNPDRDPADLAAERNLTASLGAGALGPAILEEEADTRTPDEIRAAHLAEARAVDAHLDAPLETRALPEPPKPVREVVDELLWNAERSPTAIHLSAPEFDELRADREAAPHIRITSDGVSYHGVAVAVEGGVELPAPEMPEPAVYIEDAASEARDETGGPVQEGIDFGQDTGAH